MSSRPATVQTKLALRSRERGRYRGTTEPVGVVELPTRPSNTYDVASLLCALNAADGGRLREAADLTRAAVTELGYTRGVLSTLTVGLLGLDKVVHGDQRIKLALESGDYDRMFPMAEAARVMTWGITLGVGLGQFVDPLVPARISPPVSSMPILGFPGLRADPQPVARHRGPSDNIVRRLRSWDPRWLRYEYTSDSWYLTTATGEIRITPGDGEWFLYTPFGAHEPWKWGHWRYLDLDFVMIRDAVFDRARFQQMAVPIRVGKVPQGTTERQRKLFAKQIDEMRRFAWFVLPPGLEYEMVEATGNVREVYKDQTSWGERDITIGLTGNAPMVEGQGGFSESDVFQRVTASLRGFYAGTFAAAAVEQGIEPYILDNYGINAGLVEVEYLTDPPEDQDAKLKRLTEFGTALEDLKKGLDAHGAELDFASIREIAEGLNLRVRLKNTTIVKAPLVLTPSGVEKITTVDEGRAANELPPSPDPDVGATMIAEIGNSSGPDMPTQLEVSGV